MEQYIPKSAVVAEIERLRKSFKAISVASPSRDTTLENIAKAALCRQILSFLDTLEVKDVDLESEYENFVVDDPILSRFIINGKYGRLIAKHFFELGMAVSNKAQKGEV